MAGSTPREVYFEFTAIGSVVKVSAIDAETGTEVAVMGPANATQQQLEQLALRKLRARIAQAAPD
ncbi:MAG: serine hydroxymethyltransferase [Xanthobacteraceae bacterium]